MSFPGQILLSVWAVVRLHPFAFLSALVVLYCLRNRYQRSLNTIPGPIIRSFSSIPRIISVRNGSSHLDDLELHAKYGSVVRIAPNTLSISDPTVMNDIYGAGTKFIKSRFYELAAVHDKEGLVPDPFILTNKELHTRMKRSAASAYSMNGLLHMEPWLEGVTTRLIDILDGYAGKVKANDCDLGQLVKHYAMDAVMSLTFGRDLDFMNNGDKDGMMRIIDIFTDYMAIVSPIALIRGSSRADRFNSLARFHGHTVTCSATPL